MNTHKVSKAEKQQLKTWLRRNRFKPAHSYSWRTFLKYEMMARKGDRLYRFRTNENEFRQPENYVPQGFTVDVSCPIADFDRWANSSEQSGVPIAEWLLEQCSSEDALFKNGLKITKNDMTGLFRFTVEQIQALFANGRVNILLKSMPTIDRPMGRRVVIASVDMSNIPKSNKDTAEALLANMNMKFRLILKP